MRMSWLADCRRWILRQVRSVLHDFCSSRFHRSLVHLTADYLPLATGWVVWDNRAYTPKRLAFSGVHDIELVKKLIGL